MGIREVAAAAKLAEDAAKEAETKRIRQVNARRGEESVKKLLGLEGKAVRAYQDREREHGQNTTVRLEEGIYVKVALRSIYGEGLWGRQEKIGSTPCLILVNEEGSARNYGEFTTLGELSVHLEEAEAKEARLAEMVAQRAAQAKS